MVEKPKSAYDLAMERLEAADRESGVKETSLSRVQKEAIAEARRVATSRLAEQEILFRDAMRKTADAAEREKAEDEYRISRKRIEADRDRAIESIRAGQDERVEDSRPDRTSAHGPGPGKKPRA